MIAACARHDRIAAAQAILPDEMWRDVRIAWLREVAVRGSPNEATVTRRVEPTLCLAVGDDRRRRLLLLMVALASAASVAAAASAVAVVELVVLPASRSVFVSVAALVPVMVAMLAVLARRSLVGTSLLARRTLLLLSQFARRFR
jgi:hypothetical protein